jgi:hypothetical protein
LTDGTVRQGLFYARSLDGGRTFSDPMPIGDPMHQPGRVQVLALPHALWLAWKEFDGETTTVQAMRSTDNGTTWSKPTPLLKTAETSDHPILLSDGKRGFLSWQTQTEGYRLVALRDPS